MNVKYADVYLAHVARAIAEPARSRILCCLLDGHARTSTELAVVAEVSPSTASAHLARLQEQQLIIVKAQGKYRYYQLASQEVGNALEGLLVVAGLPRSKFTTRTPRRLRNARTCYDHIAGSLAVAIHDHFLLQRWLMTTTILSKTTYELTDKGTEALEQLGLDVKAMHLLRRRFAYPCVDWSERRPHIAGSLGAALLQFLLRADWVEQELDSRALSITQEGQRQLKRHFGLQDEKMLSL